MTLNIAMDHTTIQLDLFYTILNIICWYTRIFIFLKIYVLAISFHNTQNNNNISVRWMVLVNKIIF